MTNVPGQAITVYLKVTQNGAAYSPTPAPTVTAATLADGTPAALTVPAAMTPVGTGSYSLQVFTAGEAVASANPYSVTIHTSDTSVDGAGGANDGGALWVASWSVGTNYVSQFATSAVAQIMDYALSAVTTAGSWAKYVSDGIATILSGGSAPTLSQIINGVLNTALSGYTTPDSLAVQTEYIAGQAAKIGSSSFTMNAPQAILPTPPIVTNRTYSHAYGNQIDFTVSNLSISLQDAGVSVQWRFNLGGAQQHFTAVITSATAGYFEIAQADTADWGASPAGGYPVQVVVLKSTGPSTSDVIEIVEGHKNVVLGIAPGT